jgi:hypothetical protein
MMYDMGLNLKRMLCTPNNPQLAQEVTIKNPHWK